MDIIQQIMLVFSELIEKVKAIFSFVNSQFRPTFDIDDSKEKNILKK